MSCQVTPSLSFTAPEALKAQVSTCLNDFQARGIRLDTLNTRAIADDVALLAKTLGYGQLNLYGMSYGTRLAQEVVRRWPELVRLQILDGVIDPDETWFVQQSRHQHDTLLRFGAACVAAGSCPSGTNLPAQIQSAAEAVEQTNTTYQPQIGGSGVALPAQRITGELMLLSFQTLGYSPYGLQSLPLKLGLLQNRDAQTIALIPWEAQRAGGNVNWPTYAAVICQDSRLDEASIQAAHAGLPPIFQKMATLTRTLAGFCVQAGLTPPADTLTPVTANIPTLLISGRFDAVTTVDVAEVIAACFQPHQHVIFEAGGHVNGIQDSCGLGLLLGFLNSPIAPLNTPCAAQPLRWTPGITLPGTPQ